MSARKSHAIAGAAAAALGALTGVGYRRFRLELQAAQLRVSVGSSLANTASGPIEYAQQGQGDSLLIVHGAGGGFDQGLLFTRGLAERGLTVTAMSRFGYLRTPLPEVASPEAQADAHASLLDALGIERTTIVGASAGAPSALQFAIRHPRRCSGLVLLVPMIWAPGDALRSVHRPARLAEFMIRWLVLSDPFYWMALHVARNSVIQTVLGTPPSLLETATCSEQARIDEVLHSVLPLRARSAGLRNDARVAASLARYELEKVDVPTLVIALRDDLYGMYAGAHYTAEHIPGAKFIGYEQGGHLWVGHQDALMGAVASFARDCAEPAAAEASHGR